MEYYNGKSLDELYVLLSKSSPDYMQSLTVEEVNKVYSALNIIKLPKLVEEFLFKAGKQFRPWDGMDYKLIDYNGNFVNYVNDIIDLFENLDKRNKR